MDSQQENTQNYAYKSTTARNIGTPIIKNVSPLENQVQGLSDSIDQLTSVVNALSARLTSVLRQPELNEGQAPKEQILSPLPEQIRMHKEAVMQNVLAIRDLLDRLEI